MSQQFRQVSFGLGKEMYVTACVVCEEPVKNWSRNKPHTFKCKTCRAKEKELNKAASTPLKRMKSERRLEIAVEHLEKQCILPAYEKPLKIIGQHLYKDGWFQSSDEILVALELIRSGVKIRHQVKMGKWTVDFIIPDLKVVLEVDGLFFHSSSKKSEQIRDAAIIASLGPEWEIIRITDKMIEKNIQKLVPAIKRVVSERQRVRKNFDCRLPNWYSVNHK